MSGGTEIESDLFESHLMKWRQFTSDTKSTAIQAQFEVCLLVCTAIQFQSLKC